MGVGVCVCVCEGEVAVTNQKIKRAPCSFDSS